MQEGPLLGKRARLVNNSAMPASRSDLYEFLDARGIAWRTVDHPPVFTVEQGRGHKADMPGGHSKNLFLKDKKDRLYLVTAQSDTAVDLVGLGKAIGSGGRLSFGRPELMTATLGVEPGSVTPFSLINPSARALTAFILDVALMRHPLAWFHPLSNDASTGVAPEGLLEFVRACGVEPRLIDLAAPQGRTSNPGS